MKLSQSFGGLSLKSAFSPSSIGATPDRGFTLIELLVAITIIGILVGIGSVSFNTIQEKGRDTKRKQDLQSLKIAFEAYHADFGIYPPNPSINSGTVFTSDQSLSWIPELSPTYLKQLPQDPKQGVYRYEVPAARQTFTLWAKLENSQDSEISTKTTANCYNPSPPSQYNFCVENP